MARSVLDRLRPSPTVFFWLLLVAEKALCLLIIYNVSYTEIDWTAYMQQTTQFMNGERDYTLIKGGTGPLVYPAGFLYIFSVLNWITGAGENVILAQWIYADFAVLTMYIVLTLYMLSNKVPWYTYPLLLLSKRMHSIFVLRLFNDPIAMLPLYFSIYTLTKSKPITSSLLFSLALSIKMNILLFAPGYALVMYQTVGLARSVGNAGLVVAVQVGLAAPFWLEGRGAEYVGKAFEFGRRFLWEWTVNWRFLGKEVFEGEVLAVGLVVAHVGVLGLFLGKWCR
ncbi:dolichyl-P-Man:Man(5)GlcNAc(2)-PP-dolichol alpha-1,3-mannosyltransferase [Podochytrium sp. JEL0797]|nr:dolichyl-P-Man:Man(5)GlcNAc(2)-PP-dolichol alpha-1,3-mannosyltransferase [Podochytrium sp. JEL0797]